MSKTALLSDIHGNIDALKAVLRDIDQQGISEILCLGDIVGYGAAPAECLRLVRKRCKATVIGNHDAYTLVNLDDYNLERRVRDGIIHAQKALTKEEKQWILSLPLSAEVGAITIVHATLHIPDSFEYLKGRTDFLRHFEKQRTPVSFFGHTHKPEIALLKGDLDVGFGIPGEGEVLLDRARACAINVGSVGQPRDGSTRATYGIYDPEQHSFTLRRVSYDIEKAAQRILDTGLPEENALRLFKGA
jgi:predicted phosphodiesterase